MSGPTNDDDKKDPSLEEPLEALSNGLSDDHIGDNAQTNEQIKDALNPLNFVGNMNPQDLKDDSAQNNHGYSSGDAAKAAVQQYNDALSGAGEGRVAGTIFSQTEHKKEEEERHKRHADGLSNGNNGILQGLSDALDDLENIANDSDNKLDDLTDEITLTIYELEEQQNKIRSLLDDQQKELAELQNGTSLLLQGEDPDSDMGRAQIALKEAEIRNTESRSNLVSTTLENTKTELQDTQDAQAEAKEKIADLKEQLKTADSSEIKGLNSQLTVAEESLQKATDKIDDLGEREKLNQTIMDLSQEAQAASTSCGIDPSVEMEKAMNIDASTAMIDKLSLATSDGKLSQSEISDLKDSFDKAGISDKAQESFINAYASSGGKVGTGELDDQGNEIVLEGNQASDYLMGQLDVAIAEKEASIAANQATVSQANEVLASSSERDLELANASVDTVNNMSRVVDVIKDGNNEVYVDRGQNGAEDSYYYLNDDGTKNNYDPNNPEDAAKISQFEAESNPPQFSPAPPPLTSSFNAIQGLQTLSSPAIASSSPFLSSNLQSTPANAKRFANEDAGGSTYQATAEKDIASDAVIADKSKLDDLEQIKEKVANNEMSKQEAEIAIANVQGQNTTDSAAAGGDNWNGTDGIALTTSEEMQDGLQKVYAQVEGGSITQENLDNALGADASPELRAKIEQSLENDGYEIVKPDEPNADNGVEADATNNLTASYPVVGIGPFEVPQIQTQQPQADPNGVYPSGNYSSFADNEFNDTNPSFAKGYEPTYAVPTNNGTENIPQAGETFALAQTNQLNQATDPSPQDNDTAAEIIRMQREAELRMAEMGPANQGGAGGIT